jgi:hypothetical protein
MATRIALVLGLAFAVGCGPQPFAPPAPRGTSQGAQMEGQQPVDNTDPGVGGDDGGSSIGSGSPESADDGGTNASDDLMPVSSSPDLAPPPPVPGSTMPGTCGSGNGVYCGGDGVTGDSRALYDCTNGTLTVLAVCDTQCVHAPAGSPDYCR